MQVTEINPIPDGPKIEPMNFFTVPGRLSKEDFRITEDDKNAIVKAIAQVDTVFPDFTLPARKIFLKGFRNSTLVVEKKVEDDSPCAYVTAADKEIESLFRKWVGNHFPTHSVYGEEQGRSGQQKMFEWKIDPIDGTKNYKNGNPNSSIVVALCYKGAPVFAACDLPNQDELYIASLNQGILKNGQPIAKVESHPFTVVTNAFRTERRKNIAVGKLAPYAQNIYTKTSTLCEVIDVVNGVADVGVWCEAEEHEWPTAILLAHESGCIVWELGKTDGSFNLSSGGRRSFAIARNQESFQLACDKVELPLVD